MSADELTVDQVRDAFLAVQRASIQCPHERRAKLMEVWSAAMCLGARLSRDRTPRGQRADECKTLALWIADEIDRHDEWFVIDEEVAHG